MLDQEHDPYEGRARASDAVVQVLTRTRARVAATASALIFRPKEYAMGSLVGLVVFCGVIGITAAFPLDAASSWAQETPTEPNAPAMQPAPAASATQAKPPSSGRTLWELATSYPRPVIWGSVLAAVIIIGAAVLLYRTPIRAGAEPLILRLSTSFFFWLGMLYTALLLLMAAVYILCFPDTKTALLGGILPIAVPWFGALGAVTISLEGVFLLNNQWESKYNYWHIGRPLFGAVLGIVAFFIFVVIGASAGTPPKFLDVPPPQNVPPKDFIIYYVLAFLVGYREETFRELIKRATDLILKPGTPQPAVPAVAFKVGGATPLDIRCPPVAPNTPSRVTVEVQNAGTAPLVGPAVTVASVAPTPANTFATDHDQVTGGGDLAPGQTRRVDVVCTPPAVNDFVGTLTVTATNLATPKTIRVAGRGQ